MNTARRSRRSFLLCDSRHPPIVTRSQHRTRGTLERVVVSSGGRRSRGERSGSQTSRESTGSGRTGRSRDEGEGLSGEVSRTRPFVPDSAFRVVREAPHLDVELRSSREVHRFLAKQHRETSVSSSLILERGRNDKLTARGKKIGNQLSMSPAARSGWIDNMTSPYKTASKYPANPWQMPARGMWKLRCVDRALW